MPLAAVERAAVTINVTDLLANEPRLPLPVRQRAEALIAYYQENGGPLLWVGRERMDDIRRAPARCRRRRPRPAVLSGRPAGQARRRRRPHRRAQPRHHRALFLRRLPRIRLRPPGRPAAAAQGRSQLLPEGPVDRPARGAGPRSAAARSLDAFFDGWQPQAPDYAALKRALADYRAIAATGGWPSVPLGDSLKPGMSDSRVPALRARLAVTDGAPRQASGPAELYDRRPGRLRSSGSRSATGWRTTASSAGTPSPRSTCRSRSASARSSSPWSAGGGCRANLGRDHLIVNIAGFELRHVENGEVVDRMAVVVGKPYSRTPVFSDRVRYLEFNPYWNVPTDIAIKEELPKLQDQPGGAPAAGFEAVRGDQVYQLTAIDWSQYGPGNFPFLLRQRPGPTNALGRVKFMFPNQFNVYLHDTPSRGVFAEPTAAPSATAACACRARSISPPRCSSATPAGAGGASTGWSPAASARRQSRRAAAHPHHLSDRLGRQRHAQFPQRHLRAGRQADQRARRPRHGLVSRQGEGRADERDRSRSTGRRTG